MKPVKLRAAGQGALALLLAAFSFMAGCGPSFSRLLRPEDAAARNELRPTDADRAQLEKEYRESKGRGPMAARALYFTGLDDYHAGRMSEAGQKFQRVEKEHPGSGWDKNAVFMMGATLEKLGDLPRAFVQYQRLLPQPRPLTAAAQAAPLALDLALAAPVREACERISGAEFSDEDLARLIALPPHPDFEPKLRLKAITRLAAQKKAGEVFAAIEEFHKRFPSRPYAAEIEALARGADQGIPVDARALGLVLPLSGPGAPFGQQARQGAQLMLEEANAQLGEGSKLRFEVADEAAGFSGASSAARSLFDEKQVIAVLGPLSSDSSRELLPLAEAHRTLLFSPGAARADLAGISPYFFRNCITAEKQGQAMADHAVLELKLTRVASLWRDDAYGRAMNTAFMNRISELAATVAVSVSFAAGTRDFKDHAVQLGGINPSALKDADAEEKRDQQRLVEAASNRLGGALQAVKARLEAAAANSPRYDSEAPTSGAFAPLSFPARVAVADFSTSSAAARHQMGRAFSDRFARVLGQLEELIILDPASTSRAMEARGLDPESLNPSSAADLAISMGADYFLGGTAVDLNPDLEELRAAAALPGKEGLRARREIERYARNEVFLVTAQLIDARSASITSSFRFEVEKLRPPKSNSYGLQGIFLPGNADEVSQAVSAIKFCDLKMRLLGGDLWMRPELIRHDNVDALEDSRFTTGFYPEGKSEAVRRFVEAYKKRFAEPPTLHSAQAYDAAGMLISLLKGGASTREELRQGLLNYRNYEGVSGRTDFNGRQDAVKRLPVIRVNSSVPQLEQVQ